MKTWSSIVVVSLLVIGAYLYIGALEPTHERDWYDFYERTPDAYVSTTSITLKNVRDWNHSTTEVLDQTWHDEIEVSLPEVATVWFGLAPFGTTGFGGHSFLTFELADGTTYTLSIEARREVGEKYGAFRGIFNQYELWYGWGTERDFLSASLFLLDRPLEYYKLNLTPEEAQAVFTAVARETARIANEPAFYNTLDANCTNLLAKAVNESYPNRLPYHNSWNLPGRSVRYLQQQALIDPNISAEDHRLAATVDRHDPELLSTSNAAPAAFSAALREQLDHTIE